MTIEEKATTGGKGHEAFVGSGAMLGHNAKLVPGVAGQTAVNSQKGYRTRVDERVSERALRVMYLRGFEKMVREAQP